MLEKFLMNFFGNKQVKKAARENGLSSRNSNTFFFFSYCFHDQCHVILAIQ